LGELCENVDAVIGLGEGGVWFFMLELAQSACGLGNWHWFPFAENLLELAQMHWNWRWRSCFFVDLYSRECWN